MKQGFGYDFESRQGGSFAFTTTRKLKHWWVYYHPSTYSYIYPPLRCPVNGETYRSCFDVICMFPIRKSQKEIQNVLFQSNVLHIGWRGKGFSSVMTAASARKDGAFLLLFVLASLSFNPPRPALVAWPFLCRGKEKETGSSYWTTTQFSHGGLAIVTSMSNSSFLSQTTKK
jgi:hypothetical protein